MKKLLSLALVLAMMLTMSTTAFAAEIKQDTENKTGTTEVTHTVSDSYIVTIPDSMTIGTDANVSVSGVTLAKDYNLAVSVSSTQYDNGWKLKNNEETIGYTLKIDNEDVANNGIVLTAESGGTDTKTLVTVLDGTAKYSGSYTDTLTFSVTLKEPYSYDATSVTADTLKTALANELKAGVRNITVTLPANADSTMFTAIRRALIDTEGVADGSINLTLKGVTTIPDHDQFNVNTAIFGFITRNENGKAEYVTQLKSVNLPDVLTIGAYAFKDCKNLTVLTAPKVQTIGNRALSNSGLTSVDLPEATTIGDYAFVFTNATEFHLPKVTVLGNQALDLGNFNNEVTIYLKSADEIEVHKGCFNVMNYYNTLATKVNLVLNDNKQSQVSGNTWTTKDNNGNEVSFTFKSITFVDSNN